MKLSKSILAISICFTFSANAQMTKKELLQEIKKEKFRTPIDAKKIADDFDKEYKNTTKKTRNSEKKLSVVTSASIEEGEAHIAINPANNDQLVMSYMEESNGAIRFPVYYSNNAGQTWSKSSFNATSYLSQDLGAGTQAAGGGDPIFAYDKNGKLYFSWIYLAFNQNVLDTVYALMYIASSTDNGASFALEPGANHFIARAALDPNSFESYPNSDGFYDRQWFAMDLSNGANANNLYCSFVYFPNQIESPSLTGITIKKKPANTNVFNSTKSQVYSGSSQFGNVAVDNNGKLHVTFCDLTTNQIYHKVSSDGGVTFSAAHLIYTGTNLFGSQGNGIIHDRENAATNMVVDGKNNIHVTWSDFNGSDYDSYYARSTDGGNTFSSPITLSINSNKVLMPVVSAFQDKITIGGYVVNASKISDYYVMNSNDNGAFFSTPIKVTSASTDFAANAGNWFGDYYNSVRNDTKIYNIWSDGRTGNTKMYVSITNDAPLGITEISPINGSFQLEKMYPNPSSDDVNFVVISSETDNFNVSILAIDGKEISSQKTKINIGENKFSISTKSLVAGNYIISIVNNDGTKLTRKLVKN